MQKEITKTYKKYIRSKKRFIAGTLVLTLLLIVIGISMGAAKISFTESIRAIWGSPDEVNRQIILNIRLPRVLAAIFCGMALSVSGAAMQSILRNPLGSPFTLGISNAAAFGAAFAVIVFGAGSMQSSAADSVLYNNPYIITISAFFWSLVSTALILIVAKARGSTPENMILTGIIAGSLFMALTTGLQYIADDVELAAIVFWTFGDLSRASWKELIILMIVVIPILFYFIYNRWNYNVLDTGDEPAKSLGVNVNRVRTQGMIMASLATAVAVSFFGIIAFVGLVVPHIVRRMIGSDERFLLPGAALFGGGFLLLSDIIARSIISPMVLPVGIITSLIGAPLFIILLFKGIGKSQWK
ncbi:MAG: iron ABC transporter permease [Bacteroidota bacterium]|nr:iron ABC transporter permease [Bacteroidota bacterium]